MKTAEIPKEVRYGVVIDREHGLSFRKIGEKHGISHSTAQYIYKRYMQHKTLDSLPRSGRPGISNERDRRALVNLVKKNRRLSSNELSLSWQLSNGRRASARTVRRITRNEGFEWKLATKKPRLNKKSKKKRLDFCKRYQNWSETNWQRVFFSDEMNIEVDDRKCRPMLRRKRNEKYLEECVQESTRKGSGSIGIWAVLTYQGVLFFHLYEGRLDAERYIDILGNCLLPAIDFFRSEDKIIFQQDNAPCHRARIIKDWFEENEVDLLEWPAYSPDLNCIENLWSWLDKKLAKIEIENLDQLRTEVSRLLQNVPIDICQNMINSMPNRLKMCRDAKGGHTRY